MQGHPDQSGERANSSQVLLDSLIRLLSLTNLDVDRAEARYSIFGTYETSVAGSASLPTFTHAVHGANCGLSGLVELMGDTSATCGCDNFTLKQQWPTVTEIAPTWEKSIMWPLDMPEGEIRKEEARRLVWSSVMLVAGRTSFASAFTQQADRGGMFIKDYKNVCLPFSGRFRELTESTVCSPFSRRDALSRRHCPCSAEQRLELMSSSHGSVAYECTFPQSADDWL